MGRSLAAWVAEMRAVVLGERVSDREWLDLGASQAPDGKRWVNLADGGEPTAEHPHERHAAANASAAAKVAEQRLAEGLSALAEQGAGEEETWAAAEERLLAARAAAWWAMAGAAGDAVPEAAEARTTRRAAAGAPRAARPTPRPRP